MDKLLSLLDEIAEVDAQTDLWRSDLAAKLEEVIIPDKVAMELEALDAEFRPSIEAGEKRSKALAKKARLLAAQYGETVDGKYRKALVYKKVTWNDDGLKQLLGRWVADGVLTSEQLAFALQQRNEKVVAQIREIK